MGRNEFIPEASIWKLYLGTGPLWGSGTQVRNQRQPLRSPESDKYRDKESIGSMRRGILTSMRHGEKLPLKGELGLNLGGGQ